MVRIISSGIVTAFKGICIGTRVLNHREFWEAVEEAVEAYDFTKGTVPGQAKIEVPKAIPFVSGGVGRNIDDPDAYVLRSHRGKVHAYLKRNHAASVIHCSVIVYTKEAYLADPDIGEIPDEAEAVESINPTHVLVAVLAYADKTTALSPYRFVKNLAGGNNEALVWTADEIRAKAREIAEQSDVWTTVAD